MEKRERLERGREIAREIQQEREREISWDWEAGEKRGEEERRERGLGAVVEKFPAGDSPVLIELMREVREGGDELGG